MEHGPESYGVIAPMEYVVNAAIFYDIAHMRTHSSDHNAYKWVFLLILYLIFFVEFVFNKCKIDKSLYIWMT